MSSNNINILILKPVIDNISSSDMEPIGDILKKLSLSTILTPLGAKEVKSYIQDINSDSYLLLYKISFEISYMISIADLKESLIDTHNDIIGTSGLQSSVSNIATIKTEHTDITIPQMIIFLILLLR